MLISVALIAVNLSAQAPDSPPVEVHISSLEHGLIIGKVSSGEAKSALRIIEAPPQPPLTARLVDGKLEVSHAHESDIAEESGQKEPEQ